MNFTQWKNFGYPGQELTPFEPVLARHNLVTLTNYGRLCSILFVTTPVCHCLFGFFQPLRTVPLLLAAGGISRRAFLLGSAIGFLPGAAIAAFLGTAATTRQTPETLLLTCVIVAASLGALALLHRNNRIRP